MSDTTATIHATNLGCSITCKDLEASIRFYRDGIGFGVAQTYERDGKVATAIVTAGDCRLVLNQDDGKLGWDRVKGQGFFLQINVAGLADAVGVSRQSINELLRGRRAASPEMALRLARLFGNSPEFWLNAQRAVDLWDAARAIKKEVSRIKPLRIA